jgi:aldose 1-epimerase
MENCALCQSFGTLPNGEAATRILLTHESGIEVSIISFGAAVQSIRVPDKRGSMDNVVLGHDDLGSYVKQRNYFGATVGRYANRISHARFPLAGQTVELSANDGANALHGGHDGFDRRNWKLEAYGTQPTPFAIFTLVSPDGDQGYPGEMHVSVRYEVTSDRSLRMTFEATCNRQTIVNLTHHGFFNLDGSECPDILGHTLAIQADRYLPITRALIPLGGPVTVADSPFDFRTSARIGERVKIADAQVTLARGFDHNFCIEPAPQGVVRHAARLADPTSGRVMDLYTDQPGLQFYSGGYLGDTLPAIGGIVPPRYGALCLEPQAWPDSPNQQSYPSPILEAGARYRHETLLQFGIDQDAR